MPIGVIFDMDGVLVDSGPAHQESWQILARRHGREVSRERFQSTFGRPSRDIIRIIWGDSLSEDRVAELDAEKETIYRDLIRDHVPLMPGCRELLSTLRAAGLALAVATSGPPENLELVLEAGGLADFFGATVHGFEISHGKPAPDCFLLAVERIGLAPEACVVVEDAPVGIQAAAAAGMPAIALVGTYPAQALADKGAARVVERLTEITPAMIRELVQEQSDST